MECKVRDLTIYVSAIFNYIQNVPVEPRAQQVCQNSHFCMSTPFLIKPKNRALICIHHQPMQHTCVLQVQFSETTNDSGFEYTTRGLVNTDGTPAKMIESSLRTNYLGTSTRAFFVGRETSLTSSTRMPCTRNSCRVRSVDTW